MGAVDWNDPAGRLAFLERVGPDAYRAAFAEHLAASVIERRNGRALRYVQTRFGRLVAVEATDAAFRTLDEARAHADACAPFDPLAPLSRELAAYCQREGLPAACALELLHGDLTASQRRWLTVFVLRWDAAEAAAFPPVGAPAPVAADVNAGWPHDPTPDYI